MSRTSPWSAASCSPVTTMARYHSSRDKVVMYELGLRIRLGLGQISLIEGQGGYAWVRVGDRVRVRPDITHRGKRWLCVS